MCIRYNRFFFVCALDSTHTRTWPVAEQSGELAMNWTIDDGAIHSPNIGASMQNLFNMFTRAHIYFIAQIYAEKCKFFFSIDRMHLSRDLT